MSEGNAKRHTIQEHGGSVLTINSIKLGKHWIEHARPISPAPLRHFSFDEASALINAFDALLVKRE